MRERAKCQSDLDVAREERDNVSEPYRGRGVEEVEEEGEM